MLSVVAESARTETIAPTAKFIIQRLAYTYKKAVGRLLIVNARPLISSRNFKLARFPPRVKDKNQYYSHTRTGTMKTETREREGASEYFYLYVPSDHFSINFLLIKLETPKTNNNARGHLGRRFDSCGNTAISIQTMHCTNYQINNKAPLRNSNRAIDETHNVFQTWNYYYCMYHIMLFMRYLCVRRRVLAG